MYITDANINQADQLAELFHSAGEYLPYYLWEIESGGRCSPFEIGKKRISATKEHSNFSYQNIRVCIEDGRLIGACLAFKLSDKPNLLNLHEHPEPLIPILMLENRTLGAWCICLLAVVPNARKRGIAKQLMRDTELMALQHGCSEIVLTVNSDDKPARALSGTHGYISKDQLPVVPYPNCYSGSHWILLSKPVSSELMPKTSHEVESRLKAV